MVGSNLANELLWFIQDRHVKVEGVEPIRKVFALKINLPAGRAKSEGGLPDGFAVIMVEVKVDSFWEAEHQIVYEVPNVGWKIEQVAVARDLL